MPTTTAISLSALEWANTPSLQTLQYTEQVANAAATSMSKKERYKKRSELLRIALRYGIQHNGFNTYYKVIRTRSGTLNFILDRVNNNDVIARLSEKGIVLYKNKNPLNNVFEKFAKDNNMFIVKNNNSANISLARPGDIVANWGIKSLPKNFFEKQFKKQELQKEAALRENVSTREQVDAFFEPFFEPMRRIIENGVPF